MTKAVMLLNPTTREIKKKSEWQKECREKYNYKVWSIWSAALIEVIKDANGKWRKK